MSETGAPQGFPNINQPLIGLGGFITRPWFQLLVALWNRTGAALGGSVVPPGVVMDFAGAPANIPPGWLPCGQAVSRTGFPNLFTAIGTTWGAGDGSSTFDLPPQNVFSKGLGSDQVGDTGGSSSTTLSVSQLPAHSHAVTDPGHDHAVTDPGHTHAVTDPGHTHTLTDPGHHHSIPESATGAGTEAGGTTGATNTGDATTGVTVDSAATGVTNQTSTTGITNKAATTGITTDDTGGGAPITILPPYATFLKIIKT